MTGPVLCDDHDAPATRDLSWIEASGTRDEAGRSLAVCDDPACEVRALEHIETTGVFVESTPIHMDVLTSLAA